MENGEWRIKKSCARSAPPQFSIHHSQFSIPPGADVTRDVREIVRTGDHISVVDRNFKQALGFRARGVGAEQRRIGQFSLRDIFAGGLAERGRIGLDVEQVVDDLESQSGGVTVAAERVDLFFICAGEDVAEENGRGEKLAGFVFVDELKMVQCGPDILVWLTSGRPDRNVWPTL